MLGLQRDIRKFSKYGKPRIALESHEPAHNEANIGGRHEKAIDVSAGDKAEKINCCTIL